MRTFYAGLILLNLLHFVFATFVATSTGFSNIPIYSFAIPHLAVVALALVLLGYCVYSDTKSNVISFLTSLVLAATLLTAGYALNRWPGGNDGPGIAWSVFVGLLSFINVVAAIWFAISAVMRTRRVASGRATGINN